MPILDVEIVIPTGLRLDTGVAVGIANAAGEVFGSLPGRTWVKVHTLPYEYYAENGGEAPENGWPVFVTVLKATLPEAAELEREMTHLTTEIARVCRRSRECVHIQYLPEGRGRVSFGGRLVGE